MFGTSICLAEPVTLNLTFKYYNESQRNCLNFKLSLCINRYSNNERNTKIERGTKRRQWSQKMNDKNRMPLLYPLFSSSITKSMGGNLIESNYYQYAHAHQLNAMISQRSAHFNNELADDQLHTSSTIFSIKSH